MVRGHVCVMGATLAIGMPKRSEIFGAAAHGPMRRGRSAVCEAAAGPFGSELVERASLSACCLHGRATPALVEPRRQACALGFSRVVIEQRARTTGHGAHEPLAPPARQAWQAMGGVGADE
jgi:hypothetical protein